MYIREGFVTIVQSRRIRSEDRKKEKATYYHDTETILCASCSAQVTRSGEITVCPYCGAYLESSFYDWQLESFEIGKRNKKRFKYYAILLAMVLLPAVAAVFLATPWHAGLLPGALAGIVLALLFVLFLVLAKDPSKEIVRYSENTLRKNLTEYLWAKQANPSLLELRLDEFEVQKVQHTDTTTHITVKMRVREQTCSPDGRIHARTSSMGLSLSRARFPDRMKAKGAIFQEKECPSCGANYVPDQKGNCSYCGYGLYVQNRNWNVEEARP